jgi:hypothetical protein
MTQRGFWTAYRESASTYLTTRALGRLNARAMEMIQPES